MDRKYTSFARGARDLYITPVSPGNGQSKAEAQAHTGLRSTLITTVEPLKDMGQILRGYADSVVVDGEEYS